MRELKIIVCIKQVSDPDSLSSSFEVDSENKKVISVGIPPVINPFDENALEAALKIKDSAGGRIVAISMVEKPLSPVLKKALAVGADELIILEDDNFKDLDSYSTAYVISAAIKKIGEYDLIFVGRQDADWGFAQTGPILAEILSIPSISLAQRVQVEDRKVVVERLKRSGYEIVSAIMPTLIAASSEIGDLRLPSLIAIKKARQKPVTVWGISDLGVDSRKLQVKRIHKLTLPPSRERKTVFIEGESLQEKGENLALRLREDGVI